MKSLFASLGRALTSRPVKTAVFFGVGTGMLFAQGCTVVPAEGPLPSGRYYNEPPREVIIYNDDYRHRPRDYYHRDDRHRDWDHRRPDRDRYPQEPRIIKERTHINGRDGITEEYIIEGEYGGRKRIETWRPLGP